MSMNRELSKAGERLVEEFERNLEKESWDNHEDKAATADEYLRAVRKGHLAPPIRLIKFEDFAAYGRFPCCPENTRHIDSCDRNNSLLVFISHCWLRGHPDTEGWDGSPHPDNVAGDKYRLCCEGIKKLRSVFAPRVKDCYVWMDYCCMNQDNKNDLCEELEHYDRIVKVCDCLFTPMVNSNKDAWNMPFYVSFLAGYKVKLWNQGPSAYLNRAWCRVEMLYAAMIPVLENDNHNGDGSKRHTMFEAGLAYHCSQNRRPHFISDFTSFSSVPHCLPPLQHSYLDDYHPLKGHLTVESDIHHIRQLLSDLQPYIDSRTITVGYSGDTNEDGQPHGAGEMVFNDGSRYAGEWVNGLRHGYGVETLVKGDKYEGDWVNDLSCGRGTYYFAGGDVYEGEFCNGVRHGRGKCRYVVGDEYDGEWAEDKSSGKGVYRGTDGSFYEGGHSQGLRHGQGRQRCSDGSEYSGNWIEDKKCGRGVHTFATGDVYEGEFLLDHKHGQGRYQYVDGSKYNGEWKEDKKCGHGVYTWADGAVYEGEFLNGLSHGQGSMRTSDGSQYSGLWENGMRCGQGVYKFASGEVYEGVFLNDHRHGEGRQRFTDGSEYNGEWKEDKKCGHGVYIFTSCGVYEGEFKNDFRHGQGRQRFPDGSEYNGQWKEDQLCGHGVYSWANGEVYEGEWLNNLPASTAVGI